MEPTGDFWGGLGTGIANSPGWMVVGALLVVGVLFVWAKYVHPDTKEIKLRELEIRQREAENDSDRIKANAALAEQYRQTNVLVDGMRQSLDASTAHTDVLVAELRGSRDRSKEMGGTVARIDKTTQHIADVVEDIRRGNVGREGTD